MSRNRTEVRRSTKRWVSAVCSASESRSSKARVRSAISAGCASQSGGRDPSRQGVDVTLDRIESRQLLGEPIARDVAVTLRQKAPDPVHRARMMVRA